MGPRTRFFCMMALVSLLCGCDRNMYDQPRMDPYEKTSFFPDGRSARPLVEGTVAMGYAHTDTLFYTGKDGDKFAAELPFPADEARLKRGQERYNIFCTPCHDQAGYGKGMVIQRGFPKAASFHEERLRNMPVGYFFDVMTRGYSKMPSYAAQVSPEDRWAIAAYIRVLQMSQRATMQDVPAEEQRKLSEKAS